MNKALFTILVLLAFSCKPDDYGKEQKKFDRIEFVYKLKQKVEENTWKTFNNDEYDLPLIYFTDAASYIANPTDKFLKTFKSDLVFQGNQLKIYKSKNRVDSFSFHMETDITLGTPTNEYNYHSPFMMCSSYEETAKNISDIGSTEEWVTMIMHEYFHGYQYKHKSYIDSYEKEIVNFQQDSLIDIYKTNKWFKNSIDEENRLLLKALNEKDSLITNKLIASFFSLRNNRRKEVLVKLKLDISKYEKCFETMEGTARYIEYSLYNLFSTIETDSKLLKSDPAFKSFVKFHNYDIRNDKWLYLSEKTTYFYATGFNMARLLDKLKVEYKSRLFKEGKITLEDILLEKQNSR